MPFGAHPFLLTIQEGKASVVISHVAINTFIHPMDITLRLPNWRTTDLGRWDTLEDYLNFMVRSVQYTQGDDKELLLQKIDELHHYLERTLGRSDHTLVMLQLNHPDVYHQLAQKRWRMSYLGDKVPYNVDGTLTKEDLPDGTSVIYRKLDNRPAPF